MGLFLTLMLLSLSCAEAVFGELIRIIPNL